MAALDRDDLSGRDRLPGEQALAVEVSLPVEVGGGRARARDIPSCHQGARRARAHSVQEVAPADGPIPAEFTVAAVRDALDEVIVW